jgi:uncharacterized protein
MFAPTPEQRAATRVRPTRSPVMFQSWSHLLFLHWVWDAAAIQATLPEGLYVDTHDDRAYLGVVPFWMDVVRPRFCPPVPGLSWFLELNLRTYVHTADGTPGVWFYSLDCNNPVAVHLARTFFSLPYVHARQAGVRPASSNPIGYSGLDIDACADFQSRRVLAGKSTAPLNHFTYAGTASPAPAQPGTLEYFLAERYLLFSRSRRSGHLYEGRVWHDPYLLSPAHVKRAETSLISDNGFPDPVRPADHAMISPRVDVSIYGLQRLSA